MRRASMADQAASVGVLSNSAMVDLYSQLYADPDTSKQMSHTLFFIVNPFAKRCFGRCEA